MTLREQIVERATDMFLQEGVKSVRMDDISSAMGISKRTLYETFDNKEQLLLECMDHLQVRYDNTFAELNKDAKNLIEELMSVIKMSEITIESSSRFMNAINKFYPKIYDQHTNDRVVKGFAVMREKMEGGVEEGLILGSFNIDFAIHTFAESITNTFSKPQIFTSCGMNQHEAFRDLAIYFFRGLATEKGIKLIDEYIATLPKNGNNK